MKVLVVHNKYQSKNVGGEDVVYANEVRALRKELGDENVLTYDVSNDDLSRVKLLFTIWFSLRHYKAIKALVRQHKISVVHVHNFFPMLTPSVFLAAKSAGAKVFHTLHNYRLWCISGILYRDEAGICELCVCKKFPTSGIKNRCYRKSTLQSAFAQFAFWFYHQMNFFKAIDTFFVLTDFQKKKVIDLGIPEDKIALKPNGMLLNHIQETPKTGYLYIGRLEHSKGVEILLQTWKDLDPSFRLTIVGEGELEGLVKELNLPNVTFLGKVSHQHVLGLIGSSRYVIQPSLLYETFGLTIMEAMTLGTPVIGFKIGTRPEFIIHGKNGLLCDPETLQETLEESARVENYEAMTIEAKKTAQRFEYSVVAKKQVEIYAR